MGDILAAFDVVYGTALAAALAVIVLSLQEIRAARVLFIVGSLALSARWILWAVSTEQPWWVRSVVGAMIGGLVLAGLPAAIKWAYEKETDVKSQQASVHEAKIAGEFSGLTNSQLKERTIAFAAQMRNFERDRRTKSNEILYAPSTQNH